MNIYTVHYHESGIIIDYTGTTLVDVIKEAASRWSAFDIRCRDEIVYQQTA